MSACESGAWHGVGTGIGVFVGCILFPFASGGTGPGPPTQAAFHCFDLFSLFFLSPTAETLCATYNSWTQ